MDTVLEKNQTKDRHIRILASISVVAFLFGLTSIRVGITNDFISFGLHFDALQTNVLSYLNITLGICYLMFCALVLSQRKWSLTLAFIFLIAINIIYIVIALLGFYDFDHNKPMLNFVISLIFAFVSAFYVGLYSYSAPALK